MKKLLLLCNFSLLFSFLSYSQIDYQVRIDQLYSAADDSDGSGNEDPVWKVYLTDDDGGPQEASGCVNTTHTYNSWYTPPGLSTSWFTRTGTNATMFSTRMEAWEDDGCNGTCNYHDNCFLNDDDAHAPVGSSDGTTAFTGNIDFINDAPCTWNQYTISIVGDNNNGSPSNYSARISVYWEPNGGIDAGTISGDQTVCSGGDPAVFTSAALGEPANFATHFTYQWQEDVGCSGTWGDIGGAVGATYDPPVGITQSTCYRRVVKSTNCADAISNSITITVPTASTDPSSISASETLLCGAGNIDLSVVGGSLGTGATWEWYDGDPNGAGVPIGTGASLTSYAVSVTTDFFVRAESACGNTNTVTETVTVSSPNTVPTSVTSTSMSICEGDPIDLTVNGGALGSGAVWTWYDTDPTTGSPASIYSNSSATYASVTPMTPTTYYVRAEGCDTTAAVSASISVDLLSTDPTGLTAVSSSFCSGGNTDLTIQGGSLGTGATWQWYEGGCGSGVAINTGTTINVSPTVTTTYYARAEGSCGNTNCASITITVDQTSTDPASIATSNANICPGQSTVLSVSGGTLGSGATWEWYEASCGGVAAGSGNSISVSPGATTTYFIRGEGTCGNTNCATVVISVGVGATDPTSAASSVNNICPGDTTELSVTGPVLDPGYTWVWYTGACGAVPVGVGATLDVMPTATTTYYVRAVGTCGATNCTSVTVDVQSGSVTADGVTTDNNNFCPGETANLEVSGGSLVAGAAWTWYENSCGGTPIGTGTTLAVTPTTSTAYFVRAEGGTCGNTNCVNILINVLDANAYMIPFDTLCGVGASFTLNNGIPEGGTYTGTGVTADMFDPAVAGVGTHAITYTYTETNGCGAVANGEIVIIPSTIVAAASVVPETCAEGGITIQASVTGGSGFYTYQWSNGDGGNPLEYAEAGTYSVSVLDGDGCATTVADIVVDEEVSCIEMPNSFTPNNDGTNDTWNLDFTSYTSASIQVYSKWGNLVWESSGTTISWDGTYNGESLPAATYYYVLDLDGGSLTQNGPVTIVR